MQLIYPAIIRQEEDGTWKCRVPDFEGCEAAGETIDEAMEELNARARQWIEVELEEGVVLPPVSDPEDLARAEGEQLRKVCVTLKFTEGWEE